MTDQNMREEFERWMQQKWAADFDLTRNHDGDYRNHTAQVAWVAVQWQSQQAQGEVCGWALLLDGQPHRNWVTFSKMRASAEGMESNYISLCRPIDLPKLEIVPLYFSPPPAPAVPDGWDTVQALYNAASKGFFTSESCGAIGTYQYICKFQTLNDLQDFSNAWNAAMLAAAPKTI